MIIFWLVAVAMIVLALALVIPPLLKDDSDEDINRGEQNISSAKDRLGEFQRDYDAGLITRSELDQAKSELEVTLYSDLQQEGSADAINKFDGRWVSIVVTFLLPTFAGGIYLYLGTPSAITFKKQETPNPHQTQNAQMPDTKEIIVALEARLKSTPDDVRGWYLLGRSYLATGKYQKAADAFLRVQNSVGDNPDVIVQRADALAMAQGGRLAGEPSKLVNRALQLNPNQLQALWLAGKAEEEQGAYTTALKHWRKLLPQLSKDKAAEKEVRDLIANVEAKLNPSAAKTQVAASTLNGPSKTSAKSNITVSVKLSPNLYSRIDPQDTVFVFAKALNGPPLPLAVVRKQAKELPLTITLDDSMAMQPAFRLSSVESVKIGANVSKTGNAILQTGDLFGEISPVHVGDSTVVLVIDQVKN